MKPGTEFRTDFTIPKKNRGDAAPDLYSQVISDHQYNDYIAPNRYGIFNKTASNQHPSTSHSASSSSATAVDYSNLLYNSIASTNYAASTYVPNTELSMQPAAGECFPNPEFVTTSYSALGLPKEVPKLGNNYKSTLPQYKDPSLPKVLTTQFQPLFCKLCETQLSSNAMAKSHYDSKKHSKKVRQFLIDYSEETGEPLHPKARLLVKSKNELDKDPKYYHCTVCDLPLTGRLHAESHYMGKNHRRALAGNSPAGRGHFDSTGKWVREIALKTASSNQDNFGLDFLPVTAATTSTVAIAAVGPSVGYPMKKDLNVEELHCKLCGIAVTSDEQMALHISGQKHRKRLNLAISNEKIPLPLGGPVVPTFTGDSLANTGMSAYSTPSANFYSETCVAGLNTEMPFRQNLISKKHKKQINRGPSSTSNLQPVKKAKLDDKSIMCAICNVSLSSEIQLQIHVNGLKHRKLCEEKGLNHLESNGTKGPENQQYYKYRTPSGLYYCKRCNLTLNTEAQFKSHITGKKHWSKVAQGSAANTSSK